MTIRTLSDELAFYRTEVSDAIALTYRIVERFPPVETLNELRNALTHLARADDPSTPSDEVQKQLRRAHRHFERVQLDCLKMCYVTIAKQLEGDFEHLFRASMLPKDLAEQAESLHEERRALAVREAESLDTVVATYTDLVDRAQKLQKELRTRHSDLVSRAHKENVEATRMAYVEQGRREGRKETFVRGVVAGVVSSGIVAILVALVG